MTVDLVIPDPSLVVLVGAAGAGKTTFATRHFATAEILSSDAYRAKIAGDEADQRATRVAFRLLHGDLERRLAGRRLTVVDATNLERSTRAALLARAATTGLPAIAIVIDLPADVVLGRNAGRSARVVDARVVARHLARLRETLDRPGPPLHDEPFERVVVLRDARDVEAIRIVRRPHDG